MKSYFIYKILDDSNDQWIKKFSDTEKKESKHCKLLGTCTVTDEYFIDSNETVFSEFKDLSEVELTYEADLISGEKHRFSFTLSQLLVKAKEGLLPYISFKEHLVNNNPVITIKGKKLSVPS